MKRMVKRQKSLILATSSKRGQRKGLSPVIATVLLVGLVVVSGLIIFMWFRGLTQEAITKFDQNIQLICKDVKFDVRYSDEKLALSNLGNVPIYGFKVKIQGSGGYETREINEISGTWRTDVENSGGLKQGGAILLDDVAGVIGGAESIVLTPILAGTTQKGAQASFTCEDVYGYQINLI